ncbi:hypothetical protein PACTADRAFT_2034 [Pachysolen tannophilus NRRL Y-2460]|uniref:C2H2-type domain-containing protein n=1 Tax=Pachysolen tannophilus NRRL Y-2460 TaxID=669874 RepID=A0A1E4U0F3_PACTA|nr:hypothetical protein PACTADRAFT_2034 [Pachysolen tannophilus NRRL Y-2460]
MSNSIDNLIKKNSIKEKKFKCSHPGCDKSFARVDYLLRHKGNHSEVKPFNCRQCQAGFARKDLLIKHFKSKSHQKRKADIPCKYNDQITNDLEANSSIGNKVVSKEFKETSSFDYGTDSSLNTSSKNLSLRNIFNPMQNASDTLGLENISHSKMEEKNQNHLFNQGIDTESSGIHQKATPPNAFSEYRDNYGWLFGNLNNLEFEPDKLFFESLSPVLSTMNREQANLNNFNLLSEETRFQILQLLNLDDLNSLLIEDFDDFLKLYWNEFNSIYPIIHFPTFDPSKTNIYLLVSMLNIGMAYSKYTCHYKISLLVHDSLRKLLLYEVNNFEDNLELSIFQALLLNNYFGKYCGTDLQLKKSILFHGLNINLLKSLRFLEGLVEPAVSDKSSWNDWILYETSKRTAFFAYICDSQHAALFNLDQHLSIFEINLELPCTDNVWNASDLNEFFEQYDLQPKNLNPRKKPSIELNDANSNTPLLSSKKDIETLE